ncbi:MAG: ResB family protein, partial [Marmoricola sp.]|nr:ResB family protein [Marmoricola sp.]
MSGPATGYEAPPLRPRELARWTWRQLTSMRTALILLFMLALASIPGSVVPQEAVDSLRASQWRDKHPQLTPVYEKLGLFSVYNSIWFSAIYILLMISLVGCIVPRLLVYWRGVRRRPPAAPRHLSRMPQSRSFETDEDADAVVERARTLLRKRRFRVEVRNGALSSERGYLREAGNLVFHLSVLIVLVGFALGGLWGFKGGVIVVTKDSFANTLSQNDDFRAGALFDPAELQPFEFTVDDFDVTFIREGREAGMAHKFVADLTYRSSPAAEEREREISVNHPLSIDGTDVFLISHGYAPHITVRNADDTVAFSGPVVFLPEDSTFRSFGVVKVPDASQKTGNTQLGFQGEFYPTYGFIKGKNGGPFSAFPDAKNPAISVNHPLTLEGTDVFLISHGYAPHITVRNADGSTAFSGPVVFLPEDST